MSLSYDQLAGRVPPEAIETYEKIAAWRLRQLDPVTGRIAHLCEIGPPTSYQAYSREALLKMIKSPELDSWWRWLNNAYTAKLRAQNVRREFSHDLAIEYTITDVVQLAYFGTMVTVAPSQRMALKPKRKSADKFLEAAEELLPQLTGYWDTGARETIKQAAQLVKGLKYSQYELQQSGANKPCVRFASELYSILDRRFPDLPIQTNDMLSLTHLMVDSNATRQNMQQARAKGARKLKKNLQ